MACAKPAIDSESAVRLRCERGARAAIAAALLTGLAGAAAAQSGAPAGGDAPGVACLIEPHRLIKLATPVAGVLDRVLVDRGDAVSAGMLVAQLQSAVEAAELEAARVRAQDETAIRSKEARLSFLESKRARLQKLRGSSQFVSETAYEEADSDAHQARADMEGAITALRLARLDVDHAKAKLEQRSIRSTIDGVVTERQLSPGEYAYEQAQVVTIAELDPLNVEVFLPIARYGAIRPGMVAQVRPEAPVGGSHVATVTVIDQVLDSRSGTFGVRLSLANPQRLIPAGIRCEVAFPE